MAKKRRGRPPGSKNKKESLTRLAQNFAKMEVGQLRPRRSAPRILAAKVQQQREFLDAQLAELQIYANNKADAAVGAVTRSSYRKTREARVKYRSKKARTNA